MRKAYLNWSSGKDATLALHQTLEAEKLEIKTLLTTLNTDTERISMHGIRKKLLVQQAENMEIPLEIIPLKGEVSMESYNETMKNQFSKLKKEGFEKSVFGDIFLEDLKQYREKQLEGTGIQPVFPLWKQNTQKLALHFIELGYKAIVVCVSAKHLDKSFCGRLFDKEFLSDLPKNVDPCGENGEFHTFVFDGPLFKKPINFNFGEKVLRDYSPSENDKDDCFSDTKSWDTRFCFVDLLPKP